jgi:hypothetical protein
LTVGACTDLFQIDEDHFRTWQCVAEPGALSPTSTTSVPWDPQWCVKPDLVMEGGNMAVSPDGSQCDCPESLSVLTTHHEIAARPFAYFGDTSAATAAVARIAAEVMSRYPALWPETIRGLLIDSAEWSAPMERQYREALEISGMERREHVERVLRRYGYGVPQLERALWSASNALTLLVEDELQPFENDHSNEMHLHSLPWPVEALQELGATEVELRVTLSYFIEPSPARRGWKTRHRYAFHGLRFALQKPTETVEAFRKRINKVAREEGEEVETGDAAGWRFKEWLRRKGSLHHDRWFGSAADLAMRNHLAVYPVIGWWRERRHLGKANSCARYSLVVSIRTPVTSVDIYQPVAAVVANPIAV